MKRLKQHIAVIGLFFVASLAFADGKTSTSTPQLLDPAVVTSIQRESSDFIRDYQPNSRPYYVSDDRVSLGRYVDQILEISRNRGR